MSAALRDAETFVTRAIDAGLRWQWGTAAAWVRVARQALAVAVTDGLDGDDLRRADVIADRLARVAALVAAPTTVVDEDEIDVRLLLASEAIEVGDVAYLTDALAELEELSPHASTDTRTRIAAIRQRARSIGRA